MKKGIRSVMAVVLCSAALSCSACGKARQPVFPVEGQVLFNGKPLHNAFVVFHPVERRDAETPPPSGYSDKNAAFQLSTYSERDGAPVGEYRVTVEWRQVRGVDSDSVGPAPNALPAKYSRPETTPLTVRVAQGANKIEPLKLTWQ